MKRFGLLISFLMIVLLLSGCGKNAVLEKADAQKKISIAISAEGAADKLDSTSYDAAMALYGAVYEPLIKYSEKGVFKPGLADKWEISEDGRKYTFHLKKDVKFSDGTAFDGEAVKFTIERAKMMNKDTTLQTLTNLEKIEVPDKSTVELFFSETSNQVLNELSQTRPLRIMSPTAVEGKKVTGKFKNAIGTGAFTVSKSSPEATTMEPNPYFNEGNPVDYQVTFKTIDDASSRILALKSGEVDIVGGTLGEVPDTDLESLKNDNKVKTYEFEGTMSHFLAFNPDNKKLDLKVREAINYAINKKNLSNEKLTGLFQPSVQYVTKKNQQILPQDIKRSSSILEDEGYKQNSQGYIEKDGQELSFDLVIQTAEFPDWKEKAEMIENDLKKAGIKLNINLVDRETYYDILWKTKKYDLIFYRTYTDALLPYNFMQSVFANAKDGHGVLANDAELTNLLSDFGKLTDESQQQKKFDEIFARLSSQSIAVPIDYVNEKFATSDKIKTFKYSGLSDSPIDYSSLEVK